MEIPQKRPETPAQRIARERMVFMDGMIAAKYSREDAQNIDQQTARIDGLLYVGMDLNALVTSARLAPTEEAEFNSSSINKITQAFSDATHENWSTMKSYFEDIAQLSEVNGEYPARVQAFKTLASLI